MWKLYLPVASAHERVVATTTSSLSPHHYLHTECEGWCVKETRIKADGAFYFREPLLTACLLDVLTAFCSDLFVFPTRLERGVQENWFHSCGVLLVDKVMCVFSSLLIGVCCSGSGSQITLPFLQRNCDSLLH